MNRSSFKGCLQTAKKNGLLPKTIIDVGVAHGTHDLYISFPDAMHILVEPINEFDPLVKKIRNKIKNSIYISAAATNYDGTTIINVHPDLNGSSLYKEEEDSNVNGFEREVTAITIDKICLEYMTTGPYLIKIDTQGSELDVLRGAGKILSETELVILEVSFFEFFKGGPQITDSIEFMKSKGFVPYEIFGLQYRLLDKAMSQVDIAFIQENSFLRKNHFYASKEQRELQNKDKLSNHNNLLSGSDK